MITKEFLSESGIPEEKHEAILNKFDESLNEFTDKIKSVTKVDVQPDEGETKADYLARMIKIDKNDAVKSVYNNFTPVIKSAFGVEKIEGEKETDWLKRAAASKIESVQNDFTKKIREYEEKLSKGIKDTDLLKKVEDLQKVLDDERAAKETLNKEWETKFSKKDKEYLLKSDLPKFRDDVAASVKEMAVNAILSGIIDKGLEVTEKDGKRFINLGEEEKFRTIELSEYYKDKLKGIVADDAASGAGSGAGRKPADFIKLERNEALNYIRAELENKGLKRGSQDYIKEFTRLKEEWTKANQS